MSNTLTIYEHASIADWEDIVVPTNITDPVTSESLQESVQPLANNQDLLKRTVFTDGVQKVRKATTITAMKALAGMQTGDLCTCEETRGIYVWEPGAGTGDTSGDFGGLWYHTSVEGAPGRWVHTSASQTTKYLGVVPTAIPILDEDGRLTQTPPNAIVRIGFIGRQTEVTTTDATPTLLNGTLSFGDIKQNDYVKIDGGLKVLCYSGDEVTLRLRLTSSGSTSTIFEFYAALGVVAGTPSRQWVPICFTYQAPSDRTSNSLRVEMVGAATANSVAKIEHLRVEVIRP